MPVSIRSKPLSLWKRQAVACATFGLLLLCIIAALYLQSRQREWVLRQQQAQHRLEFVFNWLSQEVNRVRGDAMYLANCNAAKQFVTDGGAGREPLSKDLVQFVRRKKLYDQIRLLDLSGRETVRVNFADTSTRGVDQHALQDKSDRYYFQEARSLKRGELFVSEFDLNVEHGTIERPLKPVIRFVTPVYNETEDAVAAYLVLNYLGEELLSKLDDSTILGRTLLVRGDGHYIRGITQEDPWGWLLGHDRTFAADFPHEWSLIERMDACQLTDNGVFAARPLSLGRIDVPSSRAQVTVAGFTDAVNPEVHTGNSITAVSYLPRELVFASSNELLQRLLVLAGGVFILAIVFTRAWARATLSREMQAKHIADSEERLRELSSRLLRTQEEERRAISREIHDELGQQATAISLDLKLAERSLETQQAKPHLTRAIIESETLLLTLHEFAKRVRPAVLDDLGLLEAIDSHSLEFAKRTGVQVETQMELPPGGLPDEIADHAFRLVQESLNNVAKHAGAANVALELSVGADDRELLISVRDDGCGQEELEGRGGLGLIGMRERVDLLGGEFDIKSSQNTGTSVVIRLPLKGHPSGEAACR